MSYFNNTMTSSEARELFFELADKMYRDEITIKDFGEIISEYKDVSDTILKREWAQIGGSSINTTGTTGDELC